MKKMLAICAVCMLFVLSLTGCESQQKMQDSSNPTASSEAGSTSVEPEEKGTESSSSAEEPSVSEPEPLNSIYAELTDDQFALLTEMVAKSFYSFTLEGDDYQIAEDNPAVMECLTQIYNYAYNNYFELDPDYTAVFATKYDVVSNIENYDLLLDNFIVEYYRDSAAGKWIYTINAYSLNPDDVVKEDTGLYVDAEGYLKKDVTVYWEGDDGTLEEVGKIIDIASNREINGVIYAYALNVEFFDDSFSSGWRDGENFLTFNKQLTGKPAYYVNALDPNRSIKKEVIDYSGDIQWKPLDKSNAESGTEVYFGKTASKAFWFTIMDVNSAQDTMTVKYPSGSVETKSFSALLSSGSLYVK